MTELLRVEGLKKYFNTRRGKLHAVDDVSFTIEKGKTLGVVGESGCGKSTLGCTIIHLLESTDGKMFFNGKDITYLKGKELREYREEAQIIFQDPYSSLDPRMRVSDLIREPLKLKGGMKRSAIEERVETLMETVGLAKRLYDAFPHELDGGRRQRIGFARALALEPQFIVCDEPVSALDVSIQAQILNLLLDLQEEKQLTYLFVTHDLSVVKYISDDILVMYLGQMVEKAPSRELFDNPCHPYTKALLSAIPEPDIHKKTERIVLKGEITSPINPEPGCRFARRCIYASEQCRNPQEIEEIQPGHFVSCCRIKEIN